jgi:hypothetical protein
MRGMYYNQGKDAGRDVDWDEETMTYKGNRERKVQEEESSDFDVNEKK